MSERQKSGFADVGYSQEEWYFHWHNLRLAHKLKQQSAFSTAPILYATAPVIPFPERRVDRRADLSLNKRESYKKFG